MKKAFTIFELLIVMIIIGLLMGAFKHMFSYKDVDRLKYDTCDIHINGKLDNFFQDAILQKSVYTGSNWEKVDDYSIKFDVGNQKIDFIYSGTQIGGQIIKTINLNGTGFDEENDCFTPNYHTKLSGGNLKVSIKPGLQVDNNAGGEAGIILYTGSSFTHETTNGATGGVSLYYCEQSGGNCFERNKIIIDTKVNLIKKYFCKKKNQNHCTNWSE